MTSSCSPSAAASECQTGCGGAGGGSSGGGSSGAGGSSSGASNAPRGIGGKPICVSTGNTYIQQVDISLPGLGGGLQLKRTWNSMWPITQAAIQQGMFGPNWRSTFEERVFVGGDNYIKYSRSDGSFWSFGVNVSGGAFWSVAAPANVTATLEQGISHWTLTLPTGERRQFDNTTGDLIAIIDRNGNTTQVAYDSSNRLSTVTDPTSRTLIFTYGGTSGSLVTSVTSSVGISLTYAYDSQGRLNMVTKPDSTTISFNYNAQSLITSVLDNEGKVLESHTYDSNWRGLTSSEANGVNAFSITYP
jgi:YD repeat-containing protein